MPTILVKFRWDDPQQWRQIKKMGHKPRYALYTVIDYRVYTVLGVAE